MKKSYLISIFLLLLSSNALMAHQWSVNELKALQLPIDSLFKVIEHSKTLEEKYAAASTATFQIRNFYRIVLLILATLEHFWIVKTLKESFLEGQELGKQLSLISY